MFHLQQSYSELHSARVLLLGCRMGWFQTYFFLKGDGQSVHGLKAETTRSLSHTKDINKFIIYLKERDRKNH